MSLCNLFLNLFFLAIHSIRNENYFYFLHFYVRTVNMFKTTKKNKVNFIKILLKRLKYLF